jgi:hypothetical protein
MSRCCIDCASLFKISKETGKIIWAKDLPFNVTAVYKYGNRIYAAISNISKDRLLFAYYDIIVLNLDGDIIVEECINIFPKTTKDKYVKVEENGITREKLELGIKVDGPFTPLTELFVFKDEEGILYVIGIAGYMIYQIVNSKVRKIQKITYQDVFKKKEKEIENISIILDLCKKLRSSKTSLIFPSTLFSILILLLSSYFFEDRVYFHLNVKKNTY